MRSYHPLRFLLPVPPFTRSLAAVESRIAILRDSAETLVCRSLAFAACLLRGRRQVGLFHKACVFGGMTMLATSLEFAWKFLTSR